MKTVSSARMREIDRRCIEGLGIPGVVLMNNAGAAVFAELPRGAVVVVCGKGNNGGDGFVVARLALAAGRETTVLLLAQPREIPGDAATFLRAYQRLGGKLVVAETPERVAETLPNLAVEARLAGGTWVDAMLGTGAAGAPREPYATAIRLWPKAYTVAVDLPSGLNADTGIPGDPCLRADCTVTLHQAKDGMRLPQAQPFLGRLVVAGIGIPPVCEDDPAWLRLQPAWGDGEAHARVPGP